MVGEDGERVPQKVLAPFFNGGGDGGQLGNVGGGAQELGGEGLAEKGYWVVLLGENGSHPDAGGISLNHKW